MKTRISEMDRWAEMPGNLMAESFVNCAPTTSAARTIHAVVGPV
jgi:hypothetical protein